MPYSFVLVQIGNVIYQGITLWFVVWWFILVTLAFGIKN